MGDPAMISTRLDGKRVLIAQSADFAAACFVGQVFPVSGGWAMK